MCCAARSNFGKKSRQETRRAHSGARRACARLDRPRRLAASRFQLTSKVQRRKAARASVLLFNIEASLPPPAATAVLCMIKVRSVQLSAWAPVQLLSAWAKGTFLPLSDSSAGGRRRGASTPHYMPNCMIFLEIRLPKSQLKIGRTYINFKVRPPGRLYKHAGLASLIYDCLIPMLLPTAQLVGRYFTCIADHDDLWSLRPPLLWD